MGAKPRQRFEITSAYANAYHTYVLHFAISKAQKVPLHAWEANP